MGNLGPYSIETELASEEAWQWLLARGLDGQQVILKKLRRRDDVLAEGLRQEAALASKIFHPRLIAPLGSFEVSGCPVLILPDVAGATLEALCSRAPLAPVAIARLGCHLAEALGAIHDAVDDDNRPLLRAHGDISAASVVVTLEGDAVLLGLGRGNAAAGRAPGPTTAPELVDGGRGSTASDFYALGCILIQAATGHPLRGSPQRVFELPSGARPLTGKLAQVIASLVEQDPTRRLRVAHEVSGAFRELEESWGGGRSSLADHVTVLCPPVPKPPAPKPLPRPKAPPPEVSLELAFEPKKKRERIEAAVDPTQWYPEVKKDHRWLTEAARRIVVGLIVVSVGLFAARLLLSKKGKLQDGSFEQVFDPDMARLKGTFAKPDCNEPGALWTFTNDMGNKVIVDDVGKIPANRRKHARCEAPRQ